MSERTDNPWLWPIERKRAIELCKTGWWHGLPSRDIAGVQLFVDRLCMDFADYHKAVEDALGRPVWSHEFGLNVEGLQREFLGQRKAPTLKEIFGVIPKDKLTFVLVDDERKNT